MKRLKNFNVSVSNGNIKCPIEKKNIFAINLALKLFCATVANLLRSLKSLYTLFDTYMDYMLVEFKAEFKVLSETHKHSSLLTKTGFF